MHSIRYILHRFTLLLAVVVTTNAYAVPLSLTYSSSTFNESAANVGTINNSTPLIIVLSAGDTFTGSNNDEFVVAGKIIVTNLPAGLTVIATRISADTLSVTISGMAANHASANSISNLTFAFQNSAFVGNNAGNVTNSTKNDLAISFLDPVENALSFDGSNDVISVPASSSINLSQGTWEAWVKVNSLSHHNRIIFKEGADNNGKYELYILDNSFSGSIRADVVAGGTRYNAISSVNATAGTWTHIAATFDSTNLKIYVNGSLCGTTTLPGLAGIDANTGPLGIGGGVNPTDSRLEGSVDEVRIWNIVRTASEISADMNNANLSPSTSGLQAYYHFNHGSAGGTNTGLTTLYDATTNANNGTLNNFALTGASSNYIANDNAALPVELTSFTASVNGRGVELVWMTATEQNNYGFEIERTPSQTLPLAGGGQGGGWSKIGFVEGNGTTNSPKQYSFEDKNLSVGKYLYRLKQVDRNGQFKYSQEVEVTVNETPKTFALQQNYPNPFNPSTTINYRLPVNSHITLKIYDAIGREVTTLVNEVKEAGEYSVTFNASKFSSGMYVARLQSSDKLQMKKMLLLK